MEDPNTAWHTSAAFHEGLELFNAGHFWHAHEAWEGLWLTTDDPVRMFLQGLIQTAAALVHWERGNPRGLELNWQKARPKLVGVAPEFGGIHVAPLVAWMDAMQADKLKQAPKLAIVSTDT